MAAAAWTAIGLLATTLAVLVGALLQLGGRIEAQGRDLRLAIDIQGRELRAVIERQTGHLSDRIDHLSERIDHQSERIDAQGSELGARIDAQSIRLDEHMGHAG